MNTMKTVLFLDGSDIGTVRRLTRLSQDRKIVVIHEGNIGNDDRYQAPERYLDVLRGYTDGREFDLTILGNNEKAGLAKAAAIHTSLRRKTIVVSDGRLETGVQHEYEILGYSRFMTRTQLSRELDAILRFR
jgi:hypothetical protein